MEKKVLLDDSNCATPSCAKRPTKEKAKLGRNSLKGNVKSDVTRTQLPSPNGHGFQLDSEIMNPAPTLISKSRVPGLVSGNN